MQIQTEKRAVTRSGTIVESEFKIKATAKAFSILSSGLYSDKILAVVRELSCNAYDSHVAAGKRDVPIEIKLPNALDSTFYVKDFGTGLSKEDVYSLYSTYFDSTKADSNEFIGALGLGSKSPFSYVNSFSVESRHNGMVRLFTAMINENGVPSIAMLAEQPTTEPNGMTISLACKRGDESKFVAAAKRALMYFDVQPKVIGVVNFKPYDVKHPVVGSNWKLRNSDYYADMRGAYVVQGFVAYPIDTNIIRQHASNPNIQLILSMNIDLYVDIGAVEVAASREALSYTKHTIDNLLRVVSNVSREIRDSFQKEIDSKPTLWEAQLFHAERTHDFGQDRAMNDVYRTLDKVANFNYKGTTLEREFVVNTDKLQATTLQIQYIVAYKRRNTLQRSTLWSPTDVTKEYRFAVRPGMMVIVDDVGAGRSALVELLTANRTPGKDAYALVLRPTLKKLYDQREIDLIIKKLSVDPAAVKYVSKEVTTEKTKSYTYRAKKLDEAMTWKGFPERVDAYGRNRGVRQVFSRLCWNKSQIDVNATKLQFFVAVERFTITHNGKEVFSFADLQENATLLGILPKDAPIFGLTEKQVANVSKNKNWVNVIDYVEQRFIAMNKSNELLLGVAGSNVAAHTIGSSMIEHVVRKWKTIGPKIVDGSFKEMIEAAVKFVEMADKLPSKPSVVLDVASRFSSTKAFSANLQTMTDSFRLRYDDVMKQHAILKLVDWNRMTSSDVDMIIDYVNFVAKS